MFTDSPTITLHDPLAEFLGAGDGVFTYAFNDVVKLSGHACPTVAGAFLMVKRALDVLYPDGETPQRGGLRIQVNGGESEGVNGPISQVFTFLTGAAAQNGFHGLGGRFGRYGLLSFGSGAAMEGPRFTFERIDNGASVTLLYNPQSIPPSPEMGGAMQSVMGGGADVAVADRFKGAWRGRVEKILADGGKNTVFVAE